MKKSIKIVSFLVLVVSSFSAYAQKYKTVADTGKLNLEYVKVSNEIADLTVDLTAAQGKLIEYQGKAGEAEVDAHQAADASSEQASKATSGTVKDTKKANKTAKKAYNEAKDAKSAKDDVDDQNDKIAKLSKKLREKQERIQELDGMRATIHATIPAGSGSN